MCWERKLVFHKYLSLWNVGLCSLWKAGGQAWRVTLPTPHWWRQVRTPPTLKGGAEIQLRG